MLRRVDVCSANVPGGWPRGASPTVRALRKLGKRQQAIGFLPHRGQKVAFAVVGGGPPLLLDLGRAHDLEAFWRHPPYRRLVQRLGQRFTVVRWDRPGFGLSDRQDRDFSLAGELALLDDLTYGLGLDQVGVLAAADAGPVMIQFAARRPGRVSHLALFGTATDGRHMGPVLSRAAIESLSVPATDVIHTVVAAASSRGCEPAVSKWLTSALVTAADAVTIADMLAETSRLDARPVLPLVRAATLVLHREDDVAVAPALGRELAAGITGAEFVSLPGAAHLLYAGDSEPALRVLIPFLAGAAEEPTAVPSQLSRPQPEVVRMVVL